MEMLTRLAGWLALLMDDSEEANGVRSEPDVSATPKQPAQKKGLSRLTRRLSSKHNTSRWTPIPSRDSRACETWQAAHVLLVDCVGAAYQMRYDDHSACCPVYCGVAREGRRARVPSDDEHRRPAA